MIRSWAIIGDANAGKSTTIRHLVSQFQGPGGMRHVLLRGGGQLAIFAKIMSLQEGNQEEGGAKTPDEFVELVRRQIDKTQGGNCLSFFNVLFSLRYVSLGPSYPDANEYLTHFIHQGWQIESLVLMTPTASREQLYQSFGSPTLSIQDPTTQAISHMVGRVRNHFGWA